MNLKKNVLNNERPVKRNSPDSGYCNYFNYLEDDMSEHKSIEILIPDGVFYIVRNKEIEQIKVKDVEDDLRISSCFGKFWLIYDIYFCFASYQYAEKARDEKYK